MSAQPTAANANKLPDPDERPGADVVIFDGQCRFCRRQAERLAKWDSRRQLAFISLHDPRVAERYPDLTHDQLMDEMYVVDRAGTRWHGAGAFRYLTRQLPALWVLAPLMHIPGSLPLWQWGYRQVAKRRYLAGKLDECTDGSCAVHFEKR
ncbi:MAG: DUF393 domain-containing protein [Planctomycetales bacterium]|nr:DUF393 domain-containing protein [Planctomycetales bacterium]